VNVTRFAEGVAKLSLSGVTAQNAATCYRSSNNTNSCDMTFSGGIKLLVDVPDHAAGASGIQATIQGVKANTSQTACVAAFPANTSYDIKYSCNYSKPKTGSEKLTLGGNALSCAASTATAATTSIATKFGADAKATLALAYPDAGEVRLNASATIPDGITATGSGVFVTVPARFGLVADAGPIRAGADFKVRITALNAAGNTTPNFDAAKLKDAGATAYEVKLDIACHAQDGAKGVFFAASPSFTGGVAKDTIARWSEVGRIDLSASLTGFLGLPGLNAAGSTNSAAAGGCSGSVGAFVPQYFKLSIDAGRSYRYSREPFDIKISAMNLAGNVTTNFDAALAYSEDVALSVVDKDGVALAKAPGTLSIVKAGATLFSGGIATVKPAYAFTELKTAPLTIRLRGISANASSAFTASPDPDVAKEATTSIRSGRLRLVNRFGSARGALNMPVLAEIWSGSSWVQHTDDAYTEIPSGAFAVFAQKQSNAQASAVVFQVTKQNANIKLTGGIGTLALTPGAGGPGWADVAANLGATDSDTSCSPKPGTPKTAGVGMPWLRSVNTCTTDGKPNTDPWARATFGVFEPEARRIIHVREVFR